MTDPNFKKMPPDFKERYRLMIRKEMEERMKKDQEKMQIEANKAARIKADKDKDKKKRKGSQEKRSTLQLAR